MAVVQCEEKALRPYLKLYDSFEFCRHAIFKYMCVEEERLLSVLLSGSIPGHTNLTLGSWIIMRLGSYILLLEPFPETKDDSYFGLL